MRKIRFWIKIEDKEFEEIVELPNWIELKQLDFLFDNWKQVKIKGNWDYL